MNYYSLKNTIINFFKPHLRYKNFIKKNSNTLVIADVGSTGGLDSRWQTINDYLKVYSFDPDDRAHNYESNSNEVFSIALWSEKKKLELNLTNFPDASSVFPINNTLLDEYLNSECHKVVSSKNIEADKLENVLIGKKPVNFLKIDAEGAELEILKGSEKYLKESIIGLELEVQFVQRTINSPHFSEIDYFMRKKGFQLMVLSKQSWIRKNNLWNINANPQLIWADAVYILNKDKIIDKLLNDNKSDANIFLLKFVLICLVYGFFDYAQSVLSTVKAIDALDRNIDVVEYEKFLKINIPSNFYLITLNFSKFLFSLFLLSFIFFLWTKRKSVISFFRSSFLNLIYSLYSIFSRGGPNKVAINDFIK